MAYELTATAHDFALAREGGDGYRITGTVTATSGGWRVEVHPLNEGIVDEPDKARFLVHAIPPGEGDTVTLALEDIAVDHAFTDDAALETVFAHLQGATLEDGEDDIVLTVE